MLVQESALGSTRLALNIRYLGNAKGDSPLLGDLKGATPPFPNLSFRNKPTSMNFLVMEV